MPRGYGAPAGQISEQCREADHGKLKRLIKPTLGFKSMKTAYATLKGFEVMHALKKGQAKPWQYQDGIMGEVRLIERNFEIYNV